MLDTRTTPSSGYLDNRALIREHLACKLGVATESIPAEMAPGMIESAWADVLACARGGSRTGLLTHWLRPVGAGAALRAAVYLREQLGAESPCDFVLPRR